VVSARDGELFHLTVLTIAAAPGTADRLLAVHVNDGRGRCRICTIGGQAGHQQWPCWLYTAALEARKLVRQRPRYQR
jgi:hypothetical protein